jgi:hypothetical protein
LSGSQEKLPAVPEVDDLRKVFDDTLIALLLSEKLIRKLERGKLEWFRSKWYVP